MENEAYRRPVGQIHLTIDGMAAFACFVAIIRGQAVDEAKLKELTAIINSDTKALSDAEAANTTP